MRLLSLKINESIRGYYSTILFGMRGVPNILEGHKFFERKIGGHEIFDDPNVGSHKMTTDSVSILFKKADFNTILVCLGVRCIGDGVGIT